MRHLRTLPTRHLVALVAVVALVVVAFVVGVAVAAGAGASAPPEKPLAVALHDALAGPQPQGVSGDLTFTNNLLPTSGLPGGAASPLLTGASGRFWVTNDGRGRLELKSDAGDVQIVWNGQQATAFDASTNTVYRFTVPSSAQSADQSTGQAASSKAPPTVAEIEQELAKVAADLSLTNLATTVGNQPAYSVAISPKHDGGLVGSVELAYAAANGTPLKVAIYAKGSSSPVLALEATNVNFGPVDSQAVAVKPPADAKVVNLSNLGSNLDSSQKPATAAITGLAAVKAAAPWVSAPAALGTRALADASLHGTTASFVYGRGLDLVVIVESNDTSANNKQLPQQLNALPTVTVAGVKAHELVTPLGTVLAWQKGTISYTVFGSVTQQTAENAANALP
jgi:outer membrane lipoprotein-sorting protein